MPSDSGYTPISDTDPEEENRKPKDEGSPLKENPRPESRLDKIKNVFHKTGYPSSVWYILGNEFCERFSYYGMHAILVIYLTQMLKMDDNSATAVYHAFNMLCYFSPLFGAMLADSFLGKYNSDGCSSPSSYLFGTYPTKNTPVHCLHFTLRNLLLASGPFLST